MRRYLKFTQAGQVVTLVFRRQHYQQALMSPRIPPTFRQRKTGRRFHIGINENIVIREVDRTTALNCAQSSLPVSNERGLNTQALKQLDQTLARHGTIFDHQRTATLIPVVG